MKAILTQHERAVLYTVMLEGDDDSAEQSHDVGELYGLLARLRYENNSLAAAARVSARCRILGARIQGRTNLRAGEAA